MSNNLKIKATFDFRENPITTTNFSYIKQVSGFKHIEPQVILEGLVSPEHDILYGAAKTEYYNRSGSTNQSNFRLTVDIISGDKTIRTFSYVNCEITDYNLNTYFDTSYSYDKKSGFAVVEKFEITCRGYDIK